MPLRRRLLLLLSTVALGFLTAVAWYVCTKGFTRPWRTFIVAEFEKRGVEISLQRLTLDPFRGLVARDVKLYDARNHRRVLAQIDEMLLGVNYAEAFRGGNFLDWVDLHDARVTLPVPSASPDAAPIEATRLNARLFLPPQQLYLARAEAEILGIHVYATGRLLNPQALTAGPPAGGERSQALLELLESLHYPGAEPVLTLEFTGDLAHPEEIAIDARLKADGVRRKNYLLNNVAATAIFRRGVLELQQLSASDLHGQLRGAGNYEVRTAKFSARLESGLGLSEFVHAYGLAHRLDALTLQSAPQLDLTITGSVPHPREWRVFGHVSVEKFAYGPIAFQGFAADLSWMQGHWSVRDLRLRHESGLVEGDLIRLPEAFHARLHGRINPRELSPVLTGPLTAWLDRFDFLDPPIINLEIDGRKPTFDLVRAEGEIRLGRSTYDGAAAHHLTTKLHYADRVLTLTPFLKNPGDAEDSELVFDLAQQKVEIRPRAAALAKP